MDSTFNPTCADDGPVYEYVYVCNLYHPFVWCYHIWVHGDDIKLTTEYTHTYDPQPGPPISDSYNLLSLDPLECFFPRYYYYYYYYYFQLRTAAFKAYCAIWVRRSNFRHETSPRVSPRESTQCRKVEMGARNDREFCLNADFHVIIRDLLHAVNLRRGIDGFTSPPKEGVLWIFLP